MSQHEEQRRQLHEVWETLLATPEGRFIMFDLLDKAQIYSSTFTGERSGDFLEGRRALGLDIMSAYLMPQGAAVHGAMLQEAEDRAEARKLDQTEGKDE